MEDLAEPYRPTVLLCCAQALPLREVARRQGLVPATVCWRLQRGLDCLRRALDDAHRGDRRAWVALIRHSPLRCRSSSTERYSARSTPAGGARSSWSSTWAAKVGAAWETR